MAAGLLEGDTALVTGAASGIGRGIACALAAEGAHVVATDVDTERGAALARAINGTFIAADLAQPDAPGTLFDAALHAVERVSIFVHCASPRGHVADTVLRVAATQWDLMQTVSLRAGFLLGQAAGRHMRDAGIRGRMLFITSLHADTPLNLAHYSAAKAGMTMLMKELARALGPYGVRVNAIAPGAIPDADTAADLASLGERIPLCRLGTAEDIAGMAVALLADRFSAYVTGTTIAVDGGLALHNWIPSAS